MTRPFKRTLLLFCLLLGQAAAANAATLAGYAQAANQGDVQAMYHLARLDDGGAVQWTTRLQAKAEQGDSEAMRLLWRLDDDLGWLRRSAEAGNAMARWQLARQYQAGRSLFWPGQRQQAIDQQLRLAAMANLPQAQVDYAALLAARGEFDEGRGWYVKAVELGHVPAVAGYAYMLETGGPYRVQKDLVKAYALNLQLLALGKGSELRRNAEYSLESLGYAMTAAQLVQARQLAEQWRRSHPPLRVARDGG
jgi:TPR repeat protein